MKFKCSVCGYINDGDAPANCPKCGAPKERFEELSSDSAELIDRSRHTNLLYSKLAALLDEASALAKEGIEDNLDPGCLKIFQSSFDDFKIIQQKIKAEVATHIQKGKWG